MPDCPYVASVVAGDFIELCCYDCALYHTHSCSRTPFPLGAGAPGDAASTNTAVPGGYDDGGDSDTPEDTEPPQASATHASMAPLMSIFLL